LKYILSFRIFEQLDLALNFSSRGRPPRTPLVTAIRHFWLTKNTLRV